jgi:Ca2+-binding RTX toxin-like protein
MKNKLIISLSTKARTAFVLLTVLLITTVIPIPVSAACTPGSGGVVNCDSADDTVTGTSATTDSSTVTNTINGDGGSDNITGGDATGNFSSVTNTLNGGEGSDSVSGGNAFGYSAAIINTLNGDAGNDTIIGGSSWGGGSTVTNIINGGEGNDTIFPGGDRGTINIIDGGNGTDTLDYSNFGTGVTIDLSITTPQLSAFHESTDTITNVENLTGTSHDDTLTGNAGDNVIIGNAGNDTINGGGGKDTISGGDGNDVLILSGELGVNNAPGVHNPADAASADGGSGENTFQFMPNTYGNVILISTSGLDTLDFSRYNAPVTIDLSVNSPQLVAEIPSSGNPQANPVEPGTNQLWVSLSGLFKNVIGALDFSNTLTGNSLDNTLTGGNQNDFLNGGGGNNILNGGSGIDTDTAATSIPGDVVNKSGTWNSIELPEAQPVVTETPVATETPVVTETPAVTETPVVTETPIVTETPVITETPPTNPTLDPSNGPGLSNLYTGGAPGVIPVTGGLMKLACGPNTFTLPNDNVVTISGLCGNYWISIQSDTTNLPGNLPAGKSVLGGISVQILQGENASDLVAVEPLPQGALINYNFLLQENNLNFGSLLWGNEGNWKTLEGGQVIGNFYDVSANQPGTVVLIE